MIRETPLPVGPPAAGPRWDDARLGALEVCAQALERWPAIEAASCYLEVGLETLVERAAEVARRESGVGGRVYVGSTSDPAWRWAGGWHLVSPGDGERQRRRRRRADGDDDEEWWDFMPGHRLKWRRMAVLGSWRDWDTRSFEVAAIEAAKAAARPGTALNKCSDARGLAVRPWGYSFVYICFDLVMPVLAKPSSSSSPSSS